MRYAPSTFINNDNFENFWEAESILTPKVLLELQKKKKKRFVSTIVAL